jgi:hypothetical protein
VIGTQNSDSFVCNDLDFSTKKFSSIVCCCDRLEPNAEIGNVGLSQEKCIGAFTSFLASTFSSTLFLIRSFISDHDAVHTFATFPVAFEIIPLISSVDTSGLVIVTVGLSFLSFFLSEFLGLGASSIENLGSFGRRTFNI